MSLNEYYKLKHERGWFKLTIEISALYWEMVTRDGGQRSSVWNDSNSILICAILKLTRYCGKIPQNLVVLIQNEYC